MSQNETISGAPQSAAQQSASPAEGDAAKTTRRPRRRSTGQGSKAKAAATATTTTPAAVAAPIEAPAAETIIPERTAPTAEPAAADQPAAEGEGRSGRTRRGGSRGRRGGRKESVVELVRQPSAEGDGEESAAAEAATGPVVPVAEGSPEGGATPEATPAPMATEEQSASRAEADAQEPAATAVGNDMTEAAVIPAIPVVTAEANGTVATAETAAEEAPTRRYRFGRPSRPLPFPGGGAALRPERLSGATPADETTEAPTATVEAPTETAQPAAQAAPAETPEQQAEPTPEQQEHEADMSREAARRSFRERRRVAARRSLAEEIGLAPAADETRPSEEEEYSFGTPGATDTWTDTFDTTAQPAAETDTEHADQAEAESGEEGESDETQGHTSRRRRRRRRGGGSATLAAHDEGESDEQEGQQSSYAASSRQGRGVYGGEAVEMPAREERNGYGAGNGYGEYDDPNAPYAPYAPYGTGREQQQEGWDVADAQRQLNQPRSPFGSPEPSFARGFGPQPSGVAGPPRDATIRTGRGERGTDTPPISANQLGLVLTQAIQRQTDRLLAELRHQANPPSMTVMFPPFPSTERVGVFVDVANVLYSARGNRIAIDFGRMLDFLRGNRRLIRAHAYAPTSPDPATDLGFLNAVRGQGYRITTKNYKTFASGAKKADLDLDICMDIVRLVDAGTLDTVMLVSGDSDFLPVLEYCSDHGVRVEIAAFDDSAAAILRQSCDLFINLSLVDEIRA